MLYVLKLIYILCKNDIHMYIYIYTVYIDNYSYLYIMTMTDSTNQKAF